MNLNFKLWWHGFVLGGQQQDPTKEQRNDSSYDTD